MDPLALVPFEAITGAMRFNAERQRAIAENVANANTPRFTPQDIRRSELARLAAGGSAPGLTLMRTDSAHLDGGGRRARIRLADSPDSETTINGNAVVIEEQMAKAAQARIGFETALSLYEKSLALLRLAAQPPAR